MNHMYTIVMLAFVGFVLTAQTAHGEDVIRLQNGTLVPNTLGVGAPDSSGITILPNGTYGAYINGAVGSKIGPVLVRDYHNGTVTGSANMTVGARDNESDSNSTGNLTGSSSAPATNENLTGNPHRSQAWNAGYGQAFLDVAVDLRANHTLDFFYGYMNGSEFLEFDKGYAAALSGKPSNSPRFGDTSHNLERQYNKGTEAGMTDMGWMWTNATNAWAKQKYSPLPATTDDNYLNYYIGFDNGAWAADAENQVRTTYYHGNCGVGHTDEYCTGFKAGWNYEANALGPPPSASTSSNVITTSSKAI
jgi:hypothetical protein